MTFEEMAKDFFDWGKKWADDPKPASEEIERQRVMEKLLALFEIAFAKGRRQAQAEVLQELNARIHKLESTTRFGDVHTYSRLSALTDLRKRLES
jgi:hypothetical protein